LPGVGYPRPKGCHAVAYWTQSLPKVWYTICVAGMRHAEDPQGCAAKQPKKERVSNPTPYPSAHVMTAAMFFWRVDHDVGGRSRGCPLLDLGSWVGRQRPERASYSVPEQVAHRECWSTKSRLGWVHGERAGFSAVDTCTLIRLPVDNLPAARGPLRPDSHRPAGKARGQMRRCQWHSRVSAGKEAAGGLAADGPRKMDGAGLSIILLL